MTKYWHNLTYEEQRNVFQILGTVQELMDEYSQPGWCNYPDALSCMQGCWSLCSTSEKIVDSYASCEGCELRKEIEP